MTKASVIKRLTILRDLAIHELDEEMSESDLIAVDLVDVDALEHAIRTVELFGITGGDPDPHREETTIKELILRIATEELDKYLTGSLLDTLAADVAEGVIRNLPAIKELIWNAEEAKE